MQGIIVAAFFIASNVVAAGVFLLLGLLLRKAVPDMVDSPWPFFPIGFAAVTCAVLFLRGAIQYAAVFWGKRP